MNTYKIIGIMSGTSLDGIDIVAAQYTKAANNSWDFNIYAADTYPFSDVLITSLFDATNLSGAKLAFLDHELGVYFGSCVTDFIEKNNFSASDFDAIASHGQTIFHQPAKGFTVQIANPAVIAVKTGIPTIGDFRTKDVLYGGQGAPLVPIGDRYLFGEQADAFLNIGGFANISAYQNGVMKAYDICPANLPLNKLARSKGLEYDKNGEIARTGSINYFLLDLLNSLPYYSQAAPKSLGVEWLENEFYPLLKFDKDIENNLATVVEHIADKIAHELNTLAINRLMITGGGAKNKFLIERIQRYYKGEIIEVSSELIDFKEALIFGLLGALYLNNEPNCLASVTGASKDVIGGVLHRP
jgi:anhydro-N-acetylmuramic acid kinase